MLTLYVKTGCPYCHKVLSASENLGIEFDQKNIMDDATAAELVACGGKHQVPYLVDTDTSIEMYESDDIIAYLKEHYPQK